MGAPRRDAFQMLLVEIARPPGDVRGFPGEGDDMLAGAAAGLQDVTGPAGEGFLQDRPDRLVVAVERRRIEPAVRLDRPAILAEFDDIFRHETLQSSTSILPARTNGPVRVCREGF